MRREHEAETDQVEPSPRHVDHAKLHEGERSPPRPDPGREPGPDPRGREVRLPDGLQALHLRDVVDPPVGNPRTSRPGPDDPPPGARGRAGAPRDARPPDPLPEAEQGPVDG